MKKKIIFLTQTSGHHIEYLNHIFNEVGNFTDNQYIFILPESFHQNKDKFIWKENKNSTFIFFKDKDVTKLSKNKIIRSYQYNKLLKEKIGNLSVDDIFLIELMKFLPFLPFLFSSKIKISGIIYHIYLYKWKYLSFIDKGLNVFKFLIFRNFSCFKYIYVLNDNAAFKYFNKVYKTKKFKYLPDPIIPVKQNNSINQRELLGIGMKEQVILHFGALTETKGTLKILDFINEASKIELQKKVFIFAGVIKDDIKEEFYRNLQHLKNNTSIFIYDEFLEFSKLSSLLKISDVIFCPYTRVFQSSGVLGFAAQFNIPLIVPKEGFLGKLVKRNRLGIAYERFEKIYILNALDNAKIFPLNYAYLKNHSIDEFSDIILNDF